MEFRRPTRPARAGVLVRPRPEETVTSESATPTPTPPPQPQPKPKPQPGPGPAAGTKPKPSTSKAPAKPSPEPKPVLMQEYSLRVPKNIRGPVNLMRFNGALHVDPSTWTHVKMAKQDPTRQKKKVLSKEEEEAIAMPKYGAGSEYGREAREEARKIRFGLKKKPVSPEDQPWLLKIGDRKNNKKYKGVREGGVSDNAAYFIFTQAPDGSFEVFPVQHWYNFTPVQRYRSLTSEEAEEEFGRRNKILNYFSVMVRRRMKNDEEGEDPSEAVASSFVQRAKKSGDLKVSEMDDWADSEDDEFSEDEDGEDKDSKKNGAKGKKSPGKKKKGSDDEGVEDSDDGDDEGREVDYMSDTSGSGDSEPEKEVDIKGVDQEDALRDLLESGSESENEGEKKEGDEPDDDEAGPSPNKYDENPDSSQKKKKKKKKDKNQEVIIISDDDSDKDNNRADVKPDFGTDAPMKQEPDKAGSSSATESETSGSKRKATDLIALASATATKKAKVEVSNSILQAASAEGMTEEAVRRYLLRKPMTATELVHKFKSKKTKLSSQDMVNVIAHLLKKINPVKRMQNQKMYLYLTAPKH